MCSHAERGNKEQFGYNWDMPFSLRARVVFPVDRPPIEHGVVTIDGQRIVAVGKPTEDGDVIDLGDVAILPGFVNAHTHLEFSYLREPLGQFGMSLVDWIRLVIAARANGEKSASDAFDRGVRECIGCGATTIGDIVTGVPPQGCDGTAFVEVIGFSRARAASAFDNAIERVRLLGNAIGEHKGNETARMSVGLSPHAPYTVSPMLLDKLVLVADRLKFALAMHMAESREELTLLRDGSGPFNKLLEERSMWDACAIPRGSRPLNYLQMLSGAPRSLVIHGNYLDNEELGFLAEKRERMSLIYCPRTHAYFAHAPYPLEHALRSGVRVALGTDSRASNPDLNVLGEMRHVFETHPAVAPRQILEMATLAGAEALGRDPDVGSITPGKVANLVAVPLPEASCGDADEILTAVLSDESPVSAVWIRGRKLASASIGQRPCSS